MADVQHKDLTGSDLHEPKGVDAASADTVYVADGSGSGTWQKLTTDSLDTSSILANQVYFNAVIADVSTASFVIIPIPDDCTINSIRYVLGASISGADSTVSVVNGGGASLGSSTTIAHTGSVEGTGFTFTATSNNVLTGPTYIKIITDGGSSTTTPLYITVKATINP